jgi:hypothetical protein
MLAHHTYYLIKIHLPSISSPTPKFPRRQNMFKCVPATAAVLFEDRGTVTQTYFHSQCNCIKTILPSGIVLAPNPFVRIGWQPEWISWNDFFDYMLYMYRWISCRHPLICYSIASCNDREKCILCSGQDDGSLSRCQTTFHSCLAWHLLRSRHTLLGETLVSPRKLPNNFLLYWYIEHPVEQSVRCHIEQKLTTMMLKVNYGMELEFFMFFCSEA